MRWPLDRPNSSPVRGQNNAPAPTLVAARARSDGAVRAVDAPEGRPPRPRRRAAAPAAGAAPPRRNSYDPGAGHRPVAFAFAVGLPVALVVAVALSPIIIEKAPVLAPLTGTLIEIEKPKPPEAKPEVKPSPRSNTPTEAVRPLVDTFPPADRGVEVKPVVPDPLRFRPSDRRRGS